MQNTRPPVSLKACFAVIAVAWTVVVALSLFWTLHQYKEEGLEEARTQARTAYEKDVIYRRWNSSKGGVYVPASEATPSNPYLDVPERDIETPLGKKLTLVNPAYMTRQVHELARASQGVIGHITSLNPIRPENVPDAWESSVLERFERERSEISEVQSINGRPYMRLMRPLLTEEGCLKCHAKQGYAVGDVRGGLSVAVPLDQVSAASERVAVALIGGHVLLWLIGLAGLGIAARRLTRQVDHRQRFEQAIHEIETRHSRVFACVADAMLVFDDDGVVIEVNPATCDIFGYDRDELVGRHGSDLIHTSSPCQFEQFRLQLQAGGRFRGEAVGMRNDRSPFLIELYGTTLDLHGRPHLLAVIQDVTERRRAEQRLARMTECFLDFGSDPAENIRRLTRLCHDILGADFATYSRLQGEMLHIVAAVNLPEVCDTLVQAEGRACADAIRAGSDQLLVIRDLQQTAYAKASPEITACSLKTYVGKLVRGDAQTGGVLSLLYRDDFWPEPEDEKILSLVASAIGIEEERQKGQQRLQDSNSRLREALDREKRTSMTLEATLQQLAAATREAKAATQAKSEFLAAMSHEIRTPMTSILGFAENLLDPELGPDEQKSAIETIRRNGQHLLELINDVLDLSKIEANMLDVEQVRASLVPFVAELESLMRPRAVSKGLQFDVEYRGSVPETIVTDPTRLRQVLINLLSNAIKFTDSGSVRMAIRLAEPAVSGGDALENHHLQFDVIDTGIGLSPDQTKRLFQPFSQGDTSTTRQFGGTGLGLVISRRITERLGGDVKVQSTLGMGSTFSITVAIGSLAGVRMLESPSCIESTPKIPELEQGSTEPLICRILLAEDGPDNQRLISYILTKAGADVTVVDNGKAAIETALAASFHRRANDPQEPFDIVLMDMQMPVVDGYEATMRLRERGYTKPIIALTAHAMAEDREKCMEAGCDDFLTKPIARRKLIEVIRHFLVSPRVKAEGASSQPLPVQSDHGVNGADKAVESIRTIVAGLQEAQSRQDFCLLLELSSRVKREADNADWRSISILADTLEHTLLCDRDMERIARQIQALIALCESGPNSNNPDQQCSSLSDQATSES